MGVGGVATWALVPEMLPLPREGAWEVVQGQRGPQTLPVLLLLKQRIS